MATGGGHATIIPAVSIEELARAAQPGIEMDASAKQLLMEELEILKERRAAQGLDAPSLDNLTGLALSGGGIRSATFCLGVLQALAKYDLLKRFDYLSTVSGGGYIGGSLTWWWSDQWRPDGQPAESTVAHVTERPEGLAEDQADFTARAKPVPPGDVPPRFGVGPKDFPYGTESPTIWRGQAGGTPGARLLTNLRKHGNYLTPGNGITVLSGVSVMIRAIVLNLFVWLPVLSAVMLGLLWALDLTFGTSASNASAVRHTGAELVAAEAAGGVPAGAEGTDAQAALWLFFVDAVTTAVAFAIMAAVYFLLWKLAASRPRLEKIAAWLTRPWGIWLLGIGFLLVLLLKWLPPAPTQYWTSVRLLLAGAIILATTFALLCIVYSLATWVRLLRHASYRMRRLFEVWAAVYLTLIAGLAIMGALPDVQAWLSVQGLSSGAEVVSAGTSAGPPNPLGVEASKGIVALLAGLLGAGVAFIRSGAEVGKTLRGMGFHVPGGVVASIAAALLLYGLVLITHSVATQVSITGQGAVFFVVVAAAVLVGLLVNGNHISLGRFYRDRLMEAFMPDYETALANAIGPAPAAADAMQPHRASVAAPYHIINTNVVLINAKSRRRRIRGGDSFALTRDYCGSSATGWRATKQFMNDGMTLPTAVAISGAAANPNTGVGGVGLTRSRVVSVLMAFLNLRLGYWVPHPVGGRQHALPNHFRPGFLALLRGYHEDYPFQELSDGGHFENLGIYELIRRRVRLILVCDGGQDPGFQFEDLQTALRRIGEDFGTKVRFLPSHPIEDIIPQPGARTYPRGLELARRGFAVANLYYPPDFDADGQIRADAAPARLIYLKTTIVDGLPLELLGYKGKNPDFPDQSTGDQFFDEDQFEAYRELGYRIADSMILGLGLAKVLEDILPARAPNTLPGS
jgi:hypothetical protein